MKYKTHKLLQVGAIVILCLAAYVSIKQVEGFQELLPASNSPTLVALFEVINMRPSWYTTQQENAFNAVTELATTKGIVAGSPDENYSKVFNDAFLASKALGDKDDVTLDKIIRAANEFLISYTGPSVPNSTTLANLISSLPSSSNAPAPQWFTTSERYQKANFIKTRMNKPYPAYTTLMNTTFTNSKAAGDKDDVTLDKLFNASYNNYIPKSTTADELRESYNMIRASPFPSPPQWTNDLAVKINLVGEKGGAKFGDGQPSESIIADLEKIRADILNASKSTDERDDVIIDKISTANLNYINNYVVPASNSATLIALFNVINPVPGPAWYTTARKDAVKQFGDLAKTKGGALDNKGYDDVINKAFTDSKAAGDKDDVTLDKVIKAGTDYLNKSSSSSSSSSSDLAIYIGAGVGGAVLLGGIGYFMFSAAPAS